MIAKNKQTPATLFLLNKNIPIKNEEQRKSARLSFNKKKSSRSISQYQKWNPAKQSPSLPFQPVTRTNSQIKRIFLNKNQFPLQNLPIQKKITQIIEIFATKQSSQSPEAQRQKSRDSKSGQISLLSLRDEGKNTRTKSHVRMQSMLNHVGEDCQQTLDKTLQKIQKMFKVYEQHSEEWKVKYLSNEGDYLLDEIVKSFRIIIYDVIAQFRNTLVGNVEFSQKAILDIARDYETQINQLRNSMKQVDSIQSTMCNVFRALNQNHQKSIVCSVVWQDLQRRSEDLEQVIKRSQVYQQIKAISFINPQKMVPELQHLGRNKNQFCVSLPKEQEEGSQSCDNGESRDWVDNQNWNEKFQNDQRIKGVLKYIHNHKLKQEKQKNLNSTGLIKAKNSDMKIENWKSFQKKEKSINNFNKILSQR